MINTFLFCLLCLICLLLILEGVNQRTKIYQYPFFMAAIFISFILPQAFPLVYSEPSLTNLLPEESITRTLIMSCLCLAMCWIGYQISLPSSWFSKPVANFEPEKISKITLVYILIGGFFWLLIFNLPDDYGWRLSGESTGIFTIYVFFARLFSNTGFVLSLICYVSKPKLSSFIILTLGSIMPVYKAFFFGRRSAIAYIILAVAIAYYLFRRYLPPRTVIISAIILATILIPFIGEHRGLLSDKWEDPSNLNYTGGIEEIIEGKSASELRNAAFMIDLTASSSYYGWGKLYWDKLVFRYVPAQIVGREFKNSLYLNKIYSQRQNYTGYLIYKYGYHISEGTTVTGIADSFTQFDYFGSLIFAAIAMFFKWLWYRASAQKSLIAQIMYMSLCTHAMHIVVMGTADFLPNLLFASLLLLPIIWLAKPKKQLILSIK